MSDATYDCPRCGAPLAVSVTRCPVCQSYVGFAVPSPFTAAWWSIYAGVIIALFLLVGVVTALKG